MRVPRKIQIETFLGCNARCTYCSIHDWRREPGPMKDEVFERILEQLEPIAPDVKVISLYMDGEPLLDKKLLARVGQCKRRGLQNVGFTTNGSFLSADRSAAFLEAGLDWIAFSFDSLDAAAYERARVGLKHAAVLENIERFLALRNEGEFTTKINLRHHGQRDDLQRYQEHWRERGLRPSDEIRHIDAHNWGHGAERREGLLKPCAYVFDNCLILRDGTVPLCCVDYNAEVRFGNIMESPLLEIWNGQRFADVRALHADGRRAQVPLCGTCNIPELGI